MKAVSRVAVYVFLLSSPGLHVGAKSKAMESHYRRLEILTAEAPLKGTSEASEKELRVIRDFFVSRGSNASEFLIGKLEKINLEELRFLQGSEDPVRAAAYIGYLHEHGRSNFRKYAICNILADLFPHVTASAQNATLDAIVASYTPSSYGREDLSALNYAMLRIGPPAIPYLLRLANHRSVNVRCSISDVLHSISHESEEHVKTVPPDLNCHANEEERLSEFRLWGQWWEEVGRFVPFPRLASFFDSDTRDFVREK